MQQELSNNLFIYLKGVEKYKEKLKATLHGPQIITRTKGRK